MRVYILPVILFLFLAQNALCQFSRPEEDTTSADNVPENILTATNKAVSLHIDLENPDEVEFLLKRIHTYKYLESIELEGEADEATLKKIIYRLSTLKNLSGLTLKDNFMQKIPDNFSSLRSLKSLIVIGNKDLDYNDLFSKLSQLKITSLDLTDNDFKKQPSGISAIKTLKQFRITGSDRLDYEELMDELSKLPALTSVAIPVNFITELPKNIVKLKSLQVLDVSDNVLTEIPEDVSALKSINNLSIQGNLFLNPVKELEKFKGADIRFISMDKEISGEDIEELKKIFPNVEINFPVTEEEEEPEPGPVVNETKDPFIPEESNSGTLKAKKEFKILSDAYLAYQPIFQNIFYNFDTLGFNERYASSNYTNVYRRLPTNRAVGGTITLSMPLFSFFGKHKRQFSFFAYNDFHRFYPELSAFGGMNWIYQGEMTRRKFKKKIIKKSWSDVRILFDNNNSVFTIQLKSPAGFENIKAYPVPSMYNPKFLDQVQKTYPRRYSYYQKALNRRGERFNKDLKKNKSKYNTDYLKVQDFAWKELQARMSNTEKLMTYGQWLEYYDNIIANEKEALNKSALTIPYLLRGLTLRNYNTFPASPANGFSSKAINVNFTDQKTGVALPVSRIIVADNKNKVYYAQAGNLGVTPEMISVRQFSSNVIFIELRNGNIGVVNSLELDKLQLLPNQQYTLKAVVFNKNLDEMGACLKEASIE